MPQLSVVVKNLLERSGLPRGGALWLCAALGCAVGCPGPDEQYPYPYPSDIDGGAEPVGTCAAARPSFAADTACTAAARNTLDDALNRVGLDRCTLGYRARDWAIYPEPMTADPYRLAWFNAVHDQPVNLPGFGRTLSGALDRAQDGATPVADALGVQAFTLGAADEAPCIEPFDVDAEAPLADAVAAVIRDSGGTPDDDALRDDAADVPMDLQIALAQVIRAAGEANAAYDALLTGFSNADLSDLGKAHHYWLYSFVALPDFTDPAVEGLFSMRFDEAAMLDAAARLALRVETAQLSRFAGLTGFTFAQETPLGRIELADGAAQTHLAGEHVLLMVDTGGDDTYLGKVGAVDATQPFEGDHHVGLAVDLAGSDVYSYDEVPDALDGTLLPSDLDGRYPPDGPRATSDGPLSLSQQLRQGAGRMGIGMLFDLGGDDDSYRSLRLSQGYGEAGVGVLYDAGGNDVYASEAASQGAAFFGAGLLLDAAGDDTYSAYSLAQGFAGVRAVGTLHDNAGADRFVVDNGDPADGGDPLYWSIQIPGRSNNSFSQGAAWGVRCDGDRGCMSGGLGLLRDRRGNDVYVASVQAQASGYWFGTGILDDGAGDDTYDARYYVQGAGAHFAMALFHDATGNDTYNGTFRAHATSIGVGHDYTSAFHLDEGGDDVYFGPPLSLGSGNANGVGVLANVGGDDRYVGLNEPVLGAASFSQEWYDACGPCLAVPTAGIFIDIGGDDAYEVPVTDIGRRNGGAWVNDRSPAAWGAVEHGSGADVAKGQLLLPGPL